MAEDTPAQERTESPTPRRRQEARREGRVARSQELSSAAALLAGTALLATMSGPQLAAFAARQLEESARLLSGGALTMAGAVALLRATALGLVSALLPFALGLCLLVVLVNVAQTRGVLSWKPVTPQLTRLNPVSGIKRLVSPESLFTLLKSLAKIAVLGLVTWQVMRGAWPQLVSLGAAGALEITQVTRALAARLALTVGLSYLGIAGVDYAFQLLRTEKSLRMSRQEVVREHRETEGDPVLKGRMFSLARARARSRMLQQVPRADVVVVNPTEIAVALRYDLALAPAPVVVAIGRRKLAERIRAIAERAGVPLVENRPVARALLATATVGRTIPPALFAAVAEILAFVYRQRAARGEPLPVLEARRRA